MSCACLPALFEFLEAPMPVAGPWEVLYGQQRPQRNPLPSPCSSSQLPPAVLLLFSLPALSLGQTWAIAASLSAPLRRLPHHDHSGIFEVSFYSLHRATYLPQSLIRTLQNSTSSYPCSLRSPPTSSAATRPFLARP